MVITYGETLEKLLFPRVLCMVMSVLLLTGLSAVAPVSPGNVQLIIYCGIAREVIHPVGYPINEAVREREVNPCVAR